MLPCKVTMFLQPSSVSIHADIKQQGLGNSYSSTVRATTEPLCRVACCRVHLSNQRALRRNRAYSLDGSIITFSL